MDSIFQAANQGIAKIAIMIAIVGITILLLEIFIKTIKKKKNKMILLPIIVTIGTLLLLFNYIVESFKGIGTKTISIRYNDSKERICPTTPKIILHTCNNKRKATIKNIKKRIIASQIVEKIYCWEDKDGRRHYSNIGYPGDGYFKICKMKK